MIGPLVICQQWLPHIKLKSQPLPCPVYGQPGQSVTVIDNTFYEKLKELAKTRYQTSTNQLINACIEEFIQTQNITSYEKPKGEISEQRSLLIREELFEELEQMKEKYNLSIYKLVNIAIKNALEAGEK